MSSANAYSHLLMDMTFELVCYATATPRRRRMNLLSTLHKYPPSTRSVLDRQLSTVDMEWLRNWRRIGQWGPENPREPGEFKDCGVVWAAGRKYTLMSGTPFDQGTATYVRLVTDVFHDALRHAAETDRPTYGPLHVLIGKINEELAQLWGATKDRHWVYAGGTPPKEWPRPWEGVKWNPENACLSFCEVTPVLRSG